MNTYQSYRQVSISFKQRSMYWTQRQLITFGYILVAGTDIITTYFGITKYGLRETIPWTTWLINHMGWEGVILRFIVSSIFFLYLFRYLPSYMFKWLRIPATVILIVYMAFTTVNNSVLILSKV